MASQHSETDQHNVCAKNRAFILRLTWDSEAQLWRVVLKPADGGQPQIFADVEAAFLYVARFCTNHE
jgi:hypothetical protein